MSSRQRDHIQLFRVTGPSMEPTLPDGAVLEVDTTAYRRSRQPQRCDIVVFRDHRLPERHLVKRVAAVPGELIESRGGEMAVRGASAAEPCVCVPSTRNWGPSTVPPNHYVVLGDNRDLSKDFLYWGFLPAERIIGKARSWQDRTGGTP